METELAGGVTGRFEEPEVDRSVIPSLRELPVFSAALAHPALLKARQGLPVGSSLPLSLFPAKCKLGLAAALF